MEILKLPKIPRAVELSPVGHFMRAMAIDHVVPAMMMKNVIA
jgi:hypothetical protein